MLSHHPLIHTASIPLLLLTPGQGEVSRFLIVNTVGSVGIAAICLKSTYRDSHLYVPKRWDQACVSPRFLIRYRYIVPVYMARGVSFYSNTWWCLLGVFLVSSCGGRSGNNSSVSWFYVNGWCYVSFIICNRYHGVPWCTIACTK